MKKLTLGEWEKKYIVGTVERFDEKNTVGNRLDWDSNYKNLFQNISSVGETKNVPGLTVKESALRSASRNFIAMVELFNTSKPNPSTKALMLATMNTNITETLPGIPSATDQQKITRDIKNVATFFGADLVGICKVDKRWLYSYTYKMSEKTKDKHKLQDIPNEFQYAIVMVFAENYDLRKYFPTYISASSSADAGSREVMGVARLSAFIRNLGFKVIDCTFDDVALAIPMAMQAGLGQLGRHGLLITPQFGPRVRIGIVMTNLQLIVNSPIDFGVTEFCNSCKKCAKMCPSHSIPDGDRNSNPATISNSAGELKWQVNPETCRLNFARVKHPCHICISCCPFNKPNTLFHRSIRWFVDNVRQVDSLYVKLDDICGYGKPKKADNFWDEWHLKNHY